MTALAHALRQLAADVERGACPPELVERLARVVEPAGERRRRRDAWLAIAGAHCAGPSELYRLARRFEAGRWRVWRDHGIPEGAAPVFVALANALSCAPLPSRRQLANILGNGRQQLPTTPRMLRASTQR
jgi:hypothetical protein